MDLGSSRVYELELWSTNGVRLGDISALARNKVFKLERNEAESLSFVVDLTDFENYCAQAGIDPRVVLSPYQTEIRVKRSGSYLFGTYVNSIVFNLPAAGSAATNSMLRQDVTINSTGFLNYFKDRYVSKSYTQTDAVAIATDLITSTQAQTNGSVGVTIASSPYLTGKLRDRTFQRDNVKTKIQELTQLVDGRFDFAFSADKVFSTYAMQGSVRTDIALQFGGNGSNIASVYLERSALSLYNRVIGIGSGFGTDQLVSQQDDTVSQLNYKLREDIRQYNSVVLQATLDQNAAADLALRKDILEIPQISITTNELVGVPFLSVGDRVPISIVGHPWLVNINGQYRVERLICHIDDNDFESIELYFDNYALGA